MITAFIAYLVGCVVAFILGSILVYYYDKKEPLDWEERNSILMPAIASWWYVLIFIFCIINIYIDERK